MRPRRDLRFLTSLAPAQKAAILLALDTLVTLAALWGAGTVLHNGSDGPWAAPRDLIAGLLAVLSISHYLGLDRMKLAAYARHGIVETFITAAGLGAALALAGGIAGGIGGGAPLLPAQILLAALLFFTLSYLMRLSLLQAAILTYRLAQSHRRVLIYGAGPTGQKIAAALAADDSLLPVAFVDDNPSRQGLVVAGLQVHSRLRLPQLVPRLGIDMVVLSSPDAGPADLAPRLSGLGCEVLSLAAFAEYMTGTRRPGTLSLRDLLGRDRLERSLPESGAAYRDRHVLVTGAGGSIGAELCRQLACHRPARLVLLDHSELALYTTAQELARIAPDLPVAACLGSVCDAALVAEILTGERIDTIFHAAAYKHVPLVQQNLIEGLRNNVMGTRVMADQAARAGVKNFILISTDKAVRPSSVMGASKRLAEEVVQDHAARANDSGGSCFSMVRFGNVMGSSGSVIPLFEQQIARGGPVTVTHPQVTRYFMTIPEAVRLVLLAGSFARGGEVFVLDMGTPVSILQVARQMIRGAGLTERTPEHPDGEIEITFTGLREGEKLHEELLIGDDMLPTPHARILRAQEGHMSQIELAAALSDIRRAIEARDRDAARDALEFWVTARAKPAPAPRRRNAR